VSTVHDAEAWAKLADEVAIDAPASLSTAPHRGETSISRKFQGARCAEIELGRRHRIWVPWPTPTDEMAVLPWMLIGFRLFASLSAGGLDPIEVYPYGGFRHLAQRTLENKRSAGGAAERISILRSRGVRAEWLEMWSHDSLDALMAALIARDHAKGRAEKVTCGHDSSAIWLPAK
jgi:predicted nuclease with RNAse H fold